MLVSNTCLVFLSFSSTSTSSAPNVFTSHFVLFYIGKKKKINTAKDEPYCLFIYSYLECGPVGVTDNNTILDPRMTASSFFDGNYYPYYGRLRESRGNEAWCPRSQIDRTQYLQVDMGEVRFVCGVATQGRRSGPERTTSYKLQLSTNGIIWNIYRETNIEKVWRELLLTL